MKKKYKFSSGQILANTVITAMIVAMIAAGLMRMVFMRYTAAVNVTNHDVNARCLQMAVGQFFSYWGIAIVNGTPAPVCSSEQGVFTCAQQTSPCLCTFASTSLAGLTVNVSGTAPPYMFTATIADTQNPPSGCVQ
jgi:hypothetical protein